MEVCNVTVESTDDISVSVQVTIDYWLLLIMIVDYIDTIVTDAA